MLYAQCVSFVVAIHSALFKKAEECLKLYGSMQSRVAYGNELILNLKSIDRRHTDVLPEKIAL